VAGLGVMRLDRSTFAVLRHEHWDALQLAELGASRTKASDQRLDGETLDEDREEHHAKGQCLNERPAWY
jgi:hypothetical protein